MASNNVLMNLIRAFVTKSPEVEARAVAKSDMIGNEDRRTDPQRFFALVIAAASDEMAVAARRPHPELGSMGSDELQAIYMGVGDATEAEQAEAEAILSHRDYD